MRKIDREAFTAWRVLTALETRFTLKETRDLPLWGVDPTLFDGETTVLEAIRAAIRNMQDESE
jgi:hypothetical protein